MAVQVDPAVEGPDTNRKLAKVVAQAWLDPAYKQELVQKPKESLIKAGIPLEPPVQVTIVEDTPTHRNIILADKRLPPQNQVLSLPPAPDFYTVYAYIYNRVQQDAAFREEFLANPVGVVRALGALLPEGTTISVFFDTYEHRYFALPMTPRSRITIELNEQNVAILDATAVNANINANINANVNSQVNVNGVTNVNGALQVNGAAIATVVVAIAVLI